MKSGNSSKVSLAVAVALFGAMSSFAQDAKPNPYESISERNPFQLKPPPPPPDPNATPAAPPPPLATVEVTGILDFRSSKRALLEIVPGPGKPPVKPMLSEGERVEGVEVLAIDVENGEVKINNGGVITNLALKVPGKTGGGVPGAPALPGGAIPITQPGVNTAFAPPGQGQASAVYGGTLANANTTGRGNVTVAGGNPTATPASAAHPYAAGVQTYGGPGAYVPPQSPATTAAGNNPLVSGAVDNSRSIPPRVPRPTSQPAAQPQGAVDPAVQYINMAIQKQQAEARGKPFPPLPPVPGLEQ